MKKKKPSKISLALAYLAEHPKESQYAAAKHAGISPSQLYKRVLLDKGICPTCKQQLPKGE